MIGLIRGNLLDRTDSRLCVGVGSADLGVIGYEVHAPARLDYESILPGSPVELFIHTHVREDALDLYGFLSRDERELFLSLLQVQNVGPKMALGVLSHADPAHLIETILRGDAATLTKIPGIGKKTAERLVLELKDPFAKKTENGKFASLFCGSSPSLSSSTGARAAGRALPREAILDAKAALLGLGYRDLQIDGLLERLASQDEKTPAEVLVRNALRELGSGGHR